MTAAIVPPTCGGDSILAVWSSAFHAPALAIADELGLFREIDAAPATATELSARLRIEGRAVEALAGVMATLGFVTVLDGRYHPTEVARQYLTPSSPYYWGGFLRRIREAPIDCNKLIGALRAGFSSADARVTEMWETSKPSPEHLRAFTEAMHSHSFGLAMRAAPSMPLAGATKVLDVAGGSGSYSIAGALLRPEIRFTVMDLPPVCEVTSGNLRKYGVDDRVDALGRDMFTEAWPSGYDRVFFSDVLHDWDDDRCRVLAQRAFDSLAAGGRVLIHELLLTETKDGPPVAAAFSMVMVLVTKGRQRTASEFRALLSGVGFADVTISPTVSGYSVVQAIKR